MTDEIKTISEQLTDDFDYYVSDGETIILSNDDIKSIFLSTWDNWHCKNLKQMFYTYLIFAKDNFIREWNALNSEYNPIENYNKSSTIDNIINKGTTTNTSSLNTTATTETIDGGNISTNYTTSFESDTEKETGKNITTGGTTSTTSGGDTYTTTFGTTTKDGKTGNEITTTTEKTNGNIGVMSTQQMLTQEIEIRKYNCKFDFIKRFVGIYCFLA